MKFPTGILCLAASASEVLAHYRFTNLIANGQVQPEFKYIRQWSPIYSNSPVESVSSINIRCNVPPTTTNGAQTDVLEVAAGSTVGFKVDTGVSHPGPYDAYLGRAPGDVRAWDGAGASWFKIWQKGATSITASAISWDTTSTQWTFAIPARTPPGEYLLRFSHIGLHSAGNTNGAQFYISCAQLKITGSGTGSPAPLVAFPGAFSADDPAIKINIYWPIPQSYTPPGPAVWS